MLIFKLILEYNEKATNEYSSIVLALIIFVMKSIPRNNVSERVIQSTVIYLPLQPYGTMPSKGVFGGENWKIKK